MNGRGTSDATALRETLRAYAWALIGVSLLLGALHVLFAEVTAGRIYWFNLDKERNLSTWFNGAVFFLLACAAGAAWAWELRRNAEDRPVFRLPVLWLGVALVGLYMSLDEITILHENLFWREVRVASERRGDAWRYLTQWQILFAPAILVVTAYLTLFFANRFRASRLAWRAAWAGVGCWLGALLLEAIRGLFRESGGGWYAWQVVVEEELEMLGGIFLMTAVASYTLDIALDFTTERRRQLEAAAHWFSPRALKALAATVGVLVIGAGAAYVMAGRLAAAGAPVPGLFARALAEAGEREQSRSEAPGGGSPEIWFDDIGDRVLLPDVDAATLGRFVAEALFPETAAGEIFPELDRDQAPRIAFLSIRDRERPVRVVRGAGRGLRAAIAAAATAAGSGGLARDGRWLRVDIVDRVDASDRVDFRPPLAMARGIHGLAFDRRSGVAFLPGVLMAEDLVNDALEVQPRRMLDYLRGTNDELAERFTRMLQPRTPVPYRFFTTRSWFVEGGTLVPLYRGHRRFADLTREQLLAASRQAGSYLMRSLLPDGRFVYAYLPHLGEASSDYNMLRHAGTTYAVLELYEATGEAGYLEAARRALAYLSLTVRPCPADPGGHSCVVDEDSVKLGGNALAAVALAKFEELTGDRTYRDTMVSLVGWIQSVQSPAGEFTQHKLSYPAGTPSGFVSSYYPGEALLALARVYRLVGDESLLRSAERGARWLINVRDGGKTVADLDHDHWLLYALNEIYRLSPDPVLLDHARKIARAIVEAQNRAPEFEDWLGSYYRPPRSTPTAIRSEGLAAVYRLFRDQGQSREAERVLEALRLGLQFQLQTQLRPETALYLKEADRGLGGFQRSLTEFEIRVDYVQHNISAMLALANILED